jgi:hypothetical protein
VQVSYEITAVKWWMNDVMEDESEEYKNAEEIE